VLPLPHTTVVGSLRASTVPAGQHTIHIRKRPSHVAPCYPYGVPVHTVIRQPTHIQCRAASPCPWISRQSHSFEEKLPRIPTRSRNFSLQSKRRHLPLAPDLSPVLLTLLSPSRVIAPPHVLPPCTTASPTPPSLLALASPRQTGPRFPVLCSPLGFRADHEQAAMRITGRASSGERVSQHLVARGHVTTRRCAGERACGVRDCARGAPIDDFSSVISSRFSAISSLFEPTVAFVQERLRLSPSQISRTGEVHARKVSAFSF
jgi:hypothetical protein